jgi:hypothetical protein
MPPTTRENPSPPIDYATSTKPAAGETVDRGGEPNEFNGGNRGPLVAAILVLLVSATVVMVAFTWYRWSGVREPTTAVIMHGDASLSGTEITVAGERIVKATLDASNNYHVPILVDPGEYLVTAQFRGKPIVRTTVEVKRFIGVEFNLPTIVKDAVERGTLTLDAPLPSPSATQPAK